MLEEVCKAQKGLPDAVDEAPQNTLPQRLDRFEKELSSLINSHSLEAPSNTPDFVLAQYLRRCLENYNELEEARCDWYS